MLKMLKLRRDETGASALLITASMLLLFGFAAIAIDVTGGGFNERRLDQNGADTSVMGGAVTGFLEGDIQFQVDEVTDLVDYNVRNIGDADWVGRCPDSLAAGQLAVTASDLTLTPATECISWNAGFTEMRVTIPTQEVDTTFGAVIGFQSVATTAAANAQYYTPNTAPPFVVPFGIGAGQEICLRTSTTGPPLLPKWVGNGPNVPASVSSNPNDADPCDDTVYDVGSQFFGTLDPYMYMDPDTGGILCQNGVLEYSVANGIDHNLSEFAPPGFDGNPTGPTVRQDGCPSQIPKPYPNTMELKTGLDASSLRCGMLTTQGGVCGSTVPAPAGPDVEARLHRGDNVQSTYQFLEEDMDNAPLWAYLAPATAGEPAQCTTLRNALAVGPPTWDYYDYKDLMLLCLQSWDSSINQPLFTKDLVKGPRFAWLPYLAESNLNTEPTACVYSSAAYCVHFNAFVPAYLQGLYSRFQGGQSGLDCDPGGNQPRWGIHQAGLDQDCGRGSDDLDRLSGIVLHCQMLSSDICAKRPGALPDDPSGQPLPGVYLTR